MRLGFSDAFLPERMDDLTPEIAQRIRALGFSGIFTRFTSHDVFTVTEAQCRRVRELLADADLVMFQATGYRPALVHYDEDVRAQAVRTLREALRVAGQLGAASIDTGPGSVSPNGPWAPDPYNFTPRAQEQLVTSLRECVSAAEEHGVRICVEGHHLVTLRNASVTRDVIDAVDSPWVKIDFDPANWITLEMIYDSGAAIESMFELLGTRIASAHTKDLLLRDDMMVHIDYCPTGKGIVDHGALLRGMERLDPQAPVIIEAVGEEDVADVYATLTRVAHENGIEVLS
jgi:sugar phosphate isomerase/epimerase